MKKLSLLLVLIFLSSVAVSSKDKREATSNGVQIRLEITGSDEDGWDIDAVNPNGEKRECTVTFKLKGIDKSDPKKEKSWEIDLVRRITVSSTSNGWYAADYDAGLKGEGLKIMSLYLTCE